MRQREVFIDIYEQIMGVRFVLIIFLLFIGGSTLYYINNLVSKLEQREEKYVTLYAKTLEFFIQSSQNNNCDFTFVQETLDANGTVPSIVFMNGSPSDYRNVKELEDKSRKWTAKEKEDFLYQKIAEMSKEHKPIEMVLGGRDKGYVYYSNSLLIRQLRYFPYLLFAAFFILGSLAFIAYSSSRKAEQNRVWVGLAKETAHQLGTPITALMGWVELFKIDENFDQSIAHEIEKDIKRLEMITTRFSSIGSIPVMKNENIPEILQQTLDYLKVRISTKVKMSFESELTEKQLKFAENVKINRPLFEWVIENLCKNAVDSMGGIGDLHLKLLLLDKKHLAIDVSDTGKGIPKANLRRIFKAGFSTKKRGWGLGLTLAKRIIENYHNGKLFVKETTIGKGTTFRIVLKS